MLRELKERGLEIAEFPIKPDVLSAILQKVNANEITNNSARIVFQELLNNSKGALGAEQIQKIVEEKGLGLVSDTGELDAIIHAVVDKNAKAVADFQSGKQAAVGALIGQVMRELKGADPKMVRQLLIEKMS